MCTRTGGNHQEQLCSEAMLVLLTPTFSPGGRIPQVEWSKVHPDVPPLLSMAFHPFVNASHSSGICSLMTKKNPWEKGSFMSLSL